MSLFARRLARAATQSLVLLASCTSSASADVLLTLQVDDPSGRAVPRAHVRAIAGSLLLLSGLVLVFSHRRRRP